MQMLGRIYNGGNYRYGFNKQENDNEIAQVNGANTTANYWEYDSRLGRRWNQDPVVKISESPYMTFSGNPILFSDPSGDDVAYHSKADRRAVRWLKRHDPNFKEKFKAWKHDHSTLYVFHSTSGVDGSGVDLKNADPHSHGQHGKGTGIDDETGKEKRWAKTHHGHEATKHIHYDQASYSTQESHNDKIWSWTSDNAKDNTYVKVDGFPVRTINIPTPPSPPMPYDPNTDQIYPETDPPIKDMWRKFNTVVKRNGVDANDLYHFEGEDGGATFGDQVLVTVKRDAVSLEKAYEYYLGLVNQVRLTVEIYRRSIYDVTFTIKLGVKKPNFTPTKTSKLASD